MNLLVITDKLFPDETGGSCTYSYQTSLCFHKLGHKVDIFTGYPDKKENDKYFKGIHIYRHLNKKSIWYSAKMLKRVIDTNEYDAVLFHSVISWFIYSLIRRRLSKTPQEVAIFHGPWSKEAKLKYISQKHYHKLMLIPFIRLIEYRYSKGINKFVVLSNYMREQLELIGDGGESRKYVVIPGGVNLSEFNRLYSKDEARRKLHIANDEIVFFSMRRLDIRMGIQNAIAALNRINLGERRITYIIGGKGSYENELRRKAQDLVKARCIFAGFIPEEEINEYFCAADLFLVPSIDLEGFGLVILESLAMGLPVLVTPQGGMKELEDKLEGFYLTDGFKPEDISQKIQELFLEGKLDICYGENLKEYDWSEITKRIEVYISSIISEVKYEKPISIYNNIKL